MFVDAIPQFTRSQRGVYILYSFFTLPNSDVSPVVQQTGELAAEGVLLQGLVTERILWMMRFRVVAGTFQLHFPPTVAERARLTNQAEE